jgi:hypothetical protein
MTESQKPKEHRLNIRLSEAEWKKINHHASGTTCRSVSEYCRKVLLNKPVRVFVRNQSFDDFEEELVRLLPVLNTYADNFNHLVQQPSSDIHTLLLLHGLFMKVADDIKELLIKIADTCDPK